MASYDWIVVGGGLAGAALSYELTRAGASVLLLEQHVPLQGATYYSYGGIAYWSATDDLMRPLCQESMARYPTLADELGSEIQFREVDLLLTIDPDQSPGQVAAAYRGMLVEPRLITAEQACDIEPLLNREAIAAALHIQHGHVEPELTALAYQQATLRLGGTLRQETVKELIQQNNRVAGVVTSETTYPAAQVVVAAGGLSRSLLKRAGITVPVYFTHAEVVDMYPMEFYLNALVMPARLQRTAMEAQAGDPHQDARWDDPTQELAPTILDSGAVQFMNGLLRLGQVTRAIADPYAPIDAAQSEADIRRGVSTYLPVVRDLSGTWGHCLVAFSGDRLPLIGSLPQVEGLHLFSGFSNPFAILPPLARRYAQTLTGATDPLLAALSPARFLQT